MEPLNEELTLLANSGYPLVYLLTHEEDRARRLVGEVVLKLGRKMGVWCATGGPKGGEAGKDPIKLLMSMSKAPAGITVLLDFHVHLESAEVVRRLRDVIPHLTKAGHMLVIVSPVLVLPEELEKEITLLELPLPGRSELDSMFRALCVEEQVIFPEEFIDNLIRAARGLTEQEARRVFTKALRKGGGFKLDDISLVIEEKRKSIRKSEVLDFYPLDESLSEVGGLSEVKRWLESRSKAMDADAAEFGLPPPKGLLLIGVQGCGKSLTAKAVAGSWRLPLIRLDLGAVFGTGAPEMAIRKAIQVIESLAPVVLWVDEIEKGFADASGAGGSGGGSRVFGSFITWLQEKTAPVFVVATANDVEGLPPELLRKGRFDEMFFIDLPDVHERKAILEIHLQMRQRNPDDFALAELAQMTEHFSGAELEQGIVAGMYRAFDKQRELETADVQRELEEIVPLYDTYEEKIKALREWARTRARKASVDQSLVDLFEQE